MKDTWNSRYAQESYIYGKEPNRFFKEEIKKLLPGKLLLPAEGEGRNAVYAASLGWDVHALDYSESGKTKALKLAREFSVKIIYEIAELESYSFSIATYDAVAIIYAHFLPLTRQKIHKKLIEALKPGGFLILETFSKKQLGNPSGGPQNIMMLNSIEELRNDFSDICILHLSELQVELNEGNYHVGHAEVIRMIAQRPI